MKLRQKKVLVSLIAIMLMPLLGGAIYAFKAARECNFHQVTAGEAYRSAQMSGAELRRHIDLYNIKSILNLRGKEQEESWYKEELKVSAEKAVKHYDMPLSAYSEPTAADVRTLVGLIKSAPRPVLIHCQFGADRTGLVSAMWKVIVNNESKGEAGKQLSIFYGHLPFGPPAAMNRFFEKWSPLAASAY